MAYDINQIKGIKSIPQSEISANARCGGQDFSVEFAYVDNPLSGQREVICVPIIEGPRGPQRGYSYGIAVALNECAKLRENGDDVPPELEELEQRAVKIIKPVQEKYNKPKYFSPDWLEVCQRNATPLVEKALQIGMAKAQASSDAFTSPLAQTPEEK